MFFLSLSNECDRFSNNNDKRGNTKTHANKSNALFSAFGLVEEGLRVNGLKRTLRVKLSKLRSFTQFYSQHFYSQLISFLSFYSILCHKMMTDFSPETNKQNIDNSHSNWLFCHRIGEKKNTHTHTQTWIEKCAFDQKCYVVSFETFWFSSQLSFPAWKDFPLGLKHNTYTPIDVTKRKKNVS